MKGVNFVNIRDAGDPIALGASYAEQGADELTFLDITATVEGRDTFAELVKNIAREINIPFTVGGGIRTIQDVGRLLQAGADKITINSAAVKNPQVVTELANEFGSQCIVVAIDTNLYGDEWRVYTHGGRRSTEIETISWAREVTDRGAGEILLTSMVSDGTQAGFSLDITAAVSAELPIPVIASGGAGSMNHFKEAFTLGKADAALAASVFHFGSIPIPDLKLFLSRENIPVRIE